MAIRVEEIPGWKNMLAHCVFQPRFDECQLTVTESLQVGPLVDRVVSHFGPRVVETRLDLDFAIESLEFSMIGQRRLIGLQLQHVVVGLKSRSTERSDGPG